MMHASQFSDEDFSPFNSALRGKRILVAEDDAAQAIDLDRFLSGTGVQVIGPVATAAGGVALTRHPLDAAIVDTWLRDGSAEPLVAELQRHAIPIVLIADAYGIQQPKRYERIPLLTKPFKRVDLCSLLAHLMG